MEQYFQEIGNTLRPIFKSELEAALNQFKAQLQGDTTQNHPKYLTRQETAKQLNISLVSLTKIVYSGKLEAKQIGRRVLFTQEAIEKCLSTIKVK
jgi:excisionase family DNA binding protein